MLLLCPCAIVLNMHIIRKHRATPFLTSSGLCMLEIVWQDEVSALESDVLQSG